MKDILLKLMFNILKNYMTFTKLKKSKSLLLIHMINPNVAFTQKNIKQVLNHGLVLKKVQIVIKFNQEPWLKSDIDINSDLRKEAKNGFVKDFCKLINNLVFGKNMETIIKNGDVKLVAKKKREKKIW